MWCFFSEQANVLTHCERRVPLSHLCNLSHCRVPTEYQVTGEWLSFSFDEQGVEVIGRSLGICQVNKSTLNFPNTRNRKSVGDELGSYVLAVRDAPKATKTASGPS